MITEVILITTPEQLAMAHAIRFAVFVDEQQVPADEELDDYEPICRHFLAMEAGQPVGTARWRFTDNGIKLERFAVQAQARGTGIGMALMQGLLQDIAHTPEAEGKMIYLHAQLQAVPFYQRAGFIDAPPIFYEAGIPHYKMIRR